MKKVIICKELIVLPLAVMVIVLCLFGIKRDIQKERVYEYEYKTIINKTSEQYETKVAGTKVLRTWYKLAFDDGTDEIVGFGKYSLYDIGDSVKCIHK